MPTVTARTTVNSPRSVVWEVLADFNNIADYTSQVKTSNAADDAPAEIGVGSVRYCVLAPIGSTEEKILEFVPSERLVVALYNTKGLPVKGSTSTFTVTEIDPKTTELSFTADAQAKGGPLAGLIDKRLAKALPKGAQAMVDDLAASAEAIASEPATRA